MSRTEIYISKYLTSTIAVGIVLTLAVLSAIIFGFIGGGETFDLMAIIASAKISCFSGLFFAGIGFLVAGARVKSAGIVGGVVMLSYMLGYLGQLLGDAGEWLLYLSPFNMFSVENAIVFSQTTAIVLAVYFVAYVLCLIFGCIGYNRRDLNI